MTRYVLRRVALSLVTLWLIITIVFLINNVFPSDIGRQPRRAVRSRRRRSTRSTRSSGTNDPLPEQYGRLVKGIVTFDFGRVVRAEQAGQRR